MNLIGSMPRPTSLPAGSPAGSPAVWQARLSELPTASRLERILSPAERGRARRIGADRARDRFVAGRAFLRAVLAGVLGCEPASVPLSVDDRGKPSLAIADHRHRPCPHFNLAHSRDLLVAAVSWDVDVGIDAEALRPLTNPKRLAERILSPAELAAWSALAVPRREPALLTAWTRKEAVLKAGGWGLRRSPRGIAMPATGGSGFRPTWTPAEMPEDGSRWWVVDLPVPPGYVGAVAVRHPD